MPSESRSPEWAEAARVEALAVLAEHHGASRHEDVTLMERLFRRLGWAMLTDEAVEMLAGFYEVEADHRDRVNAENRALREAATRHPEPQQAAA